MNRRAYIFLFLGVLAVLTYTVPANHTEAEDTYYYARMIEQGEWSEMFHGHHLLYLPVTRATYQIVEAFGFEGRSITVLLAVSMISAAMAVCLLFSLLGRAKWPFIVAMFFSYGFWRYSLAVEIYVPAIALSLAALYLAQRGSFWWSTLCSIAALLLHLMCLPVVLIAIPLLHMLNRHCRKAVLHISIVSLVVASLYGLVALGAGFILFPDEMVVRGSLMQPSTWLKGLFAFGQNLISGNFLFALPSIAERLVGMFPYHMFQEELFMGSQAPALVKWIAPLSFVVSGIVLILLVIMAARRFSKFPPLGWAGLAWLVGSAALAMWFEPANPEMWIFTIPPLWIVLAVAWESDHFNWLPVAVASLLLIHNFSGGFLLVRNADSDYCLQKSAWVIEQAKPVDLVLVADSHSFSTYLQYWSSACIEDMKFQGLEDWNAMRTEVQGKIFIYGDVINLLPPVERRDPMSVDQLRQVGDALRPGLVQVHEDRFGIIYEWRGDE